MTIEEIRDQLSSLSIWFDIDYTRKEQKFRRLIALNKKTDSGIDANIELVQLYVEAEENRKKIQELENFLKNC